ncbi:hypothetical protein KUDE01_003985, partial [Dissostichus eleginoides]
MDGWMWMWRGKKGGIEALGRATQSRLQMCRQQQCGCFGPHQAALGVSPAHVPTPPVNQPSQASGSTAATKTLHPDPQNRLASDRRTPTSPLCRVRPVIVSLTDEVQRAPRVTTLFLALLPLNAACCHVGLQSPAVAQEVDDVWRGHRVPLSLSTPGNVQRPSQADRGQRAEEPLTVWPLCWGTLKWHRSREPLFRLSWPAPHDPYPLSPGQRPLSSPLTPLLSPWPRWPDGHTERKQHKVDICCCKRGLYLLTQPGLLMSVLPHHRSLLSALAYRLEPVSARYQGPHTHTHRIPPLAARGEGEVNISPNGWDSLEVSPRESARTGLITEAAQEVPQKEKE